MSILKGLFLGLKNQKIIPFNQMTPELHNEISRGLAKIMMLAKMSKTKLTKKQQSYILNQAKQVQEFEDRYITGVKDRFGKVVKKESADVLDLKGNPIDPSKPIMGGTQELQSGIIKATKQKPTAVKTEAQIKKEIEKQNKESIQRFKDKMKDPEDLAGGGVAGLLGENHRVPYIEGGMTLKEVAEDTKIDNFIEYLDLIELMRNMKGTKFHDAVYKPRELEAAGGGLAGMLGEPTYQDDNHRVPYSKGKFVLKDLPAAIKKIMEKFGKKSITTADKIKRPLKAIEAEDTKAAFDRLTNKINTQEALAKGSEKMAGPIKNVNQKSIFEPVSTDATTWLKQEKFFDPKALDMFGKKVPSNWIEVEKKAAKKLIDDLGPLDVSPNHPNYKDMKAIRQSAKDRLESIKVTEALGGNITMHDWLRMNRKNIKMSDYIKKPGAKKVVDELSGIKKAFIEKKSSPWFKDPKTLTPEEELRREFPGITDDLIKNILADDNPQRIAEVKAAMKEAMKMQEKGMPVDEIINIFKKKPTKHASGGLAGMLGE
jgi:hypothetical protein